MAKNDARFVNGKSIDLPASYSLSQNSPFNPTTEIQFSLPQSGKVMLKVYNINGRVVTTLVNRYMDAGVHSIVWDGTDNSGSSVASG